MQVTQSDLSTTDRIVDVNGVIVEQTFFDDGTGRFFVACGRQRETILYTYTGRAAATAKALRIASELIGQSLLSTPK